MILTVLFGVFACLVVHAQGDCGKGGSGQTIVGGQEAKPNDWPWMVSLSKANKNQKHSHFCGGTLVSKFHVVTAAHCVSKRGKYQVRLGEHNLKADDGTEQTIKVAKVWRHRQYGKKNGFDIAVLKLAKPAKIDNAVSLACLNKDQAFSAGKMCLVTGWGTTSYGGPVSNVLLQVAVPLQTDAACKIAYPGEVGKTEICAGYPKGGKDSCQGDSGGPLVCKNDDGRWHLTGVVSWGYECAREGKFGVYAKVSALHKWIAKRLRK